MFLMTEIVRHAAVIFNEKSAALSSFEDIEINNFLFLPAESRDSQFLVAELGK